MFRFSVKNQYLFSLSSVAVTAIGCFLFVDLIGYRVVALILLLTVSVLAMLQDIFPVLTAAFASALIWNFFFIPPTLTLRIGSTEDGLLFLMYFAVASVNAVLNFKIKQSERKTMDEEKKLKSIELYNTLLHSLSHEMRTPISTIMGAADIIQEKGEQLKIETLKELTSEIWIASIRLNRQVDNLLNMSRLEAGVLHPILDWLDLNEITHAVIQYNRHESQSVKITFNQDSDLPLFETDRGFIEQIMNNLVHNAVKFARSEVIICLSKATTSEGFKLIISDDGPGFPEEELNNVFQRFYKLKGRASQGIGLGLSITKGFTKALGGIVELRNREEGGAEFSVYIPALNSSFYKDAHGENYNIGD